MDFLDRRDKSLIGEQIGRNAQKDTARVNENPFWLDFNGDASLTKNGEQSHAHHHNRNRKRAKRNHKHKSHIILHNEKIIHKRSVGHERRHEHESMRVPDEVYSSSEVIGNIFNENDTHQRQNDGQ